MTTPATAQTLASAHPTGVPRKVLIGLTLLVLVVHLVVLQGTAAALITTPSRALPFTTRAIVLNPGAVPKLSAPEAQVAQTPAPMAKPPPKRPLAQISTSNVPVVLVEYDKLAINTIASDGNSPVTSPAATASESLQPESPAPAASATASSVPTDALPLTSSPVSAPSTPTIAYTVPGSIRLKYNVEGTKDNLNYHARAEMLWRQDGTTYEAQLEVSAFLIGSRVRTSRGKLTADGLQPIRFSDKYRSEVAAHFDHVKQRVTFSANTPDVSLLPAMQDQLSVFIQLGAMLGGAPERYPAGTKIKFETIGPRAPETWLITIEGEEKLNLPGGEISAIRLSRGTQREFDQKAELWLAPSLGYLPVRIKLTERNGDFVDQVWRATEAP
jgi:hypothetical protein